MCLGTVGQITAVNADRRVQITAVIGISARHC